MSHKYAFTIFTATLNMGNTLHRVYESLKAQKFRNFEWIIVDDGSSDNTQNIVLNWKKESSFPIKYIYQKNAGKHIARNRALQIAEGELFSTMDADDRFVENGLEVFYNTWKGISNKEKYSGIACTTMDSCSGQVIGKKFPKDVFDSNDLEAKYVYKLQGEKWGTCRTEVLKEFPFPEIKGQKFILESYVWNQIAKKYIHRYINTPLRIYHQDTKGSLSKVPNCYKYPRTHYEALLLEINIAFEYLITNKKFCIRRLRDLARFNFHCNKNYFHTLKKLNTSLKKAMFLCMIPFSIIYAFRDISKGRVVMENKK